MQKRQGGNERGKEIGQRDLNTRRVWRLYELQSPALDLARTAASKAGEDPRGKGRAQTYLYTGRGGSQTHVKYTKRKYMKTLDSEGNLGGCVSRVSIQQTWTSS